MVVASTQQQSRYRFAAVQDLDLPPAQSITPSMSVDGAIGLCDGRDYSQLPVISSRNRALLGYVDVAGLRRSLQEGSVQPADPVRSHYTRFRRRGVYQTMTPDTALEELELFLHDDHPFAVITDGARKFVLGIATKDDLEEFVKRRLH